MSDTDSILYTDDEIDEFTQGVAQYEPDAWEGDSDDSEVGPVTIELMIGCRARSGSDTPGHPGKSEKINENRVYV